MGKTTYRLKGSSTQDSAVSNNETGRPLTAHQIMEMPDGEEKHAEAMLYVAYLLKYQALQTIVRNWADKFGLSEDDWDEAFEIARVANSYRKPDQPVYPVGTKEERRKRLELVEVYA